jgi:hypothetical protein
MTHWADINGDGYPDMICDITSGPNNGEHHVMLNQGGDVKQMKSLGLIKSQWCWNS